MFALKPYQEQALEELAAYFRRVQETDANLAFYEKTGRPYFPAPGLPDLPYVCLRVPTGGGKTVMACHAVGLATRELLHAERSVVLWLAPTTTIVEQTLKALQDRRHPYREALEQSLGGAARPLALKDSLSLPQHAFDAETCVVVSTLAALRVENTDARKVYEAAGALMGHFQDLTEDQERHLERDEGGNVIESLANVLRLRCPIVIMDEAHNARTDLSFETLTRFRPSCVVEFTATPETVQRPPKSYASNVLCHVSAWELSSDHMIKMPLVLETQPQWQEMVAAALRRREELEKLSAQEAATAGEALRPIVLFQAQPKAHGKETLTAAFLRNALVEDFRVPADHVRIATAEEWELDGVGPLGSPDCEVRCIITVQKLREGWDCPPAYVLCSVAEMSAPTPIEQIFGRIMRLPGATEKRTAELNRGYVYAASASFADTAQRLTDGLVANGFDRLDVEHMVQAAHPELFPPGTLFGTPTAVVRPTASDRGDEFMVPALARPLQGTLALWEPEDLLPEDWDLGDRDATLGEADFDLHERARRGEIYTREDRGLQFRYLRDVQEQLALLEREAHWTQARLVMWLDRNIPHRDVAQEQAQRFLDRMVSQLQGERGMTLADIARGRFRLRDAAQRRIQAHREAAREVGQERLLRAPQEAVVSPERCFRFLPHGYPARAEGQYAGPYQFRKHYYPVVGDLKSPGEEYNCAVLIDQGDLVKHWVRNLPNEPTRSFWLPVDAGRFYPDFVAELEGGVYLVVEYKGEHLETGDPARKKARMGQYWQDRSEGCGIFFQATKDNLNELRLLLNPR